MKPLAIDIFCGLGGWAEGLLAEGYDVIGFDIERHIYGQHGEHRYPGQLVIQNVLTLHGSQFKNAALIVASPPCQEYSYMAMPWKKAKAKAQAIRSDTTELERLNRLFNACFRIQREASEAAGHHVPMIVENVKGAQPWVGRARWLFGSFALWGDVPALMPITVRSKKTNPARPNFDNGIKAPGMNWSDRSKLGQDFRGVAGKHALAREEDGCKVGRMIHRRDGAPHTAHLTNPDEHSGVKHNGSGAAWFDTGICGLPSASRGRKMASALIAKIPLPLSTYIARTFHPRNQNAIQG